jgi:histidine triad (HIT) family protein
MMKIGSRIGIALKRELDADAYNLHLADGTAAGQVVMHAHLHIVPRWIEDGFHWNWRQLSYADGEMAEIAAKIAGRIDRKAE